nr:hypothetical protein [Actinomadura alba]
MAAATMLASSSYAAIAATGPKNSRRVISASSGTPVSSVGG